MPMTGLNSLIQFTTTDWTGNYVTIRIINQTDENGEALPGNVSVISPARTQDPTNPWSSWLDNTATFLVNDRTFCAIQSEDPASFYQFLMRCVGKLVIIIEGSSNDVSRYQINNHAQNGQGTYGIQDNDTYSEW